MTQHYHLAVSTMLALASFSATLNGQDLRRGLIEADLIAVGRQVHREELTPDLALHRLQIVELLRGGKSDLTSVTVLDWPKLSMHNRPMPRQTRIYCLQDATSAATRAGLPADKGPYFKMVGWAGTNPLVGADLDKDAAVRFARLLAGAEAGLEATGMVDALLDTALTGTPEIRTEAAQFLSERPDLRARINALQWTRVLARVTGEVDDVTYKIALAELCAEQRLPGLPEALVLGVSAVPQANYLRTVGRLLAILQGEQATATLMTQVQIARDPKHREALLLALGATQTQSALDTLLNLRRSLGTDKAVEAALVEHHSRAARDAVLQGKKDK